ncbi:zinc ion binding [Abeliophyllum distichum]|uniref:Zinc ion binding n=1 Tax=Abeliophyllum distichum TaxID=126358 RepID=A0ABD1UR14_9LAMI
MTTILVMILMLWTFAKALVDKNEPFIPVSKEEIQKLAQWFKFGLVGKFSHLKPSILAVQQALNTFELFGEVRVGNLDGKHILLNFDQEEDYCRIFAKPFWYINGVPMRILKYSFDFDPHKESSIIPVWISLPKIPLVFYDKAILFSIASVIGTPLKLDESTAKKSRTNLARICVEMDINGPRLDRIRIGNEEFAIWQKIYYEDLPLYCSFCNHLGHEVERCFWKKTTGSKQKTSIEGEGVKTSKIKRKGKLFGLENRVEKLSKEKLENVQREETSTGYFDCLKEKEEENSDLILINQEFQLPEENKDGDILVDQVYVDMGLWNTMEKTDLAQEVAGLNKSLSDTETLKRQVRRKEDEKHPTQAIQHSKTKLLATRSPIHLRQKHQKDTKAHS